ncbi:DUF397 domain-containing protein [Streptomyces drozdowiczii]
MTQQSALVRAGTKPAVLHCATAPGAVMEREEGRQWFKSSYSGGSGTECVEAALLGDGAAVRDSKRPRCGQFRVQAAAWDDFVRSVRQDELE